MSNNSSHSYRHYGSYQQYLRHPLFKAIRSLVMNRNDGICEQCDERRSTEPHHLKYPPWGTFDVPSNMVALCHECHCKVHGKDK